MDTKGLRALIYSRVSTPSQKRRSENDLDEPSLGVQGEAMTEEATRRGWVIVQAPIEDVISGSVAVHERPGGQIIYQLANTDGFDVLMVYDNDRVGRDQDGVVAKVFRADMRMWKKQIFSVHQPVEPKLPDEYQPYEDDSALWLESVSDASSAVFIRQFRRRHAFGMQKRIEQKKLMAGTPPTGYIAERHRLLNGKTVLGERKLDPTHAPIIKRIFDLFESGQSFEHIARTLNREGLKTPRGLPWGSKTINGIIDNPVYYGATVYFKAKSIGKPDPKHPRRHRRVHMPMEKWLVVEGGQHPAIIAKEQWLRCQEIKKAKRSYGRTWGESTLLSGLVECGYCRSAMIRQSTWGGGYFTCDRYRKTGRVVCRPNSIRRIHLEDHVIDYISSLAENPAILERLKVTHTSKRLLELEHAYAAIGGEDLVGTLARWSSGRERILPRVPLR